MFIWDASCERSDLTPRPMCRLIPSITSLDLSLTPSKEGFAHLYFLFVLSNVPSLLCFFSLFLVRSEGNTSTWELCSTSTLLCWYFGERYELMYRSEGE